MNNQLQKEIIDCLREEVKPAMGCTEPVAIALAVSKARELLCENFSQETKKSIKHIQVKLSPNIFKNGMAVGIPGTKEVGLFMAISLGFIMGISEKGLEIFENVSAKDLAKAKELIQQGLIKLDIEDTQEKIYIDVQIKTKKNFSRATIQGRHDQWIHLESSEKVLVHKDPSKEEKSTSCQIYKHPIHQLLQAILDTPSENLLWLVEGIEMNMKIAQHGIKNPSGLGVGDVFYRKIKNHELGKDLMNLSMAYTSAASDARMDGVSLPVMSSNGSGNNGLTALIPLAAYAELHPVEAEKLARAAALSHMVNGAIKKRIGRLSALCGCGVAAGTGAAVGLTYLMDGKISQMEMAIQNMIANTTGMICDGAKVGCALKLATSASAAVQSAFLAVENIVVPLGNGIISGTVEETLHNLEVLSTEAMPQVDFILLSLMKNQSHML